MLSLNDLAACPVLQRCIYRNRYGVSSDAVGAIRLEIREKLNHRKLDSTSLGISLHILPDFPPDNIYSGSPSHYFGQIQFK